MSETETLEQNLQPLTHSLEIAQPHTCQPELHVHQIPKPSLKAPEKSLRGRSEGHLQKAISQSELQYDILKYGMS